MSHQPQPISGYEWQLSSSQVQMENPPHVFLALIFLKVAAVLLSSTICEVLGLEVVSGALWYGPGVSGHRYLDEHLVPSLSPHRGGAFIPSLRSGCFRFPHFALFNFFPCLLYSQYTYTRCDTAFILKTPKSVHFFLGITNSNQGQNFS